jgi:AP2 domain
MTAPRQREKPHGPVCVDACDQPLLLLHRWHRGTAGYVRRTATAKGQKRAEYLHRVILGVAPGALVDHVNGDVLDNRRSNLRACNQYENQYNVPVRPASPTGYKGVTVRRYKRGVRYEARIKSDGREMTIGFFDTAEEAGRAYEAASLSLHGAFAAIARLRVAGEVPS